ncbi:MAG: HAD family hydrolase [Firmicutes bacterium]|nr:HAD family hydrolase [Bacillota bacterium]
MREKHVFAIDIDGTLLTSNHEITARTRRAILSVREAGHHVTLATGRMAASTLPIAAQLDMRIPIICLNGADVVDPSTGESLASHPIAHSIIDRLAQRLQGSGADYFLLGHRFAVSQTRTYGSYETILTRSLEDYLPRAVEPVLKVTIECHSDALQDELFHELATWQAFDMTRSMDGSIYATAWEVTKLSGILSLCELWDVPLGRVTAFGNAENDLAMLQHVGCGIAMANSDDLILQKIHRTTLANDEDGVAVELENFLRDAVTAVH